MKFAAHLKRVIVLACILLPLIITESVSAQLILNEMMASNTSTLEDQFYEYPDWIELYNAGDATIDLHNYWLSDDALNLKKWNIPEMHLPGNSYLLVFASGKDVTTSLAYWHTLVNKGEEWRYYIPAGAVSEEWKTSSAFTSGWNTGSSGIGYSDNDDATQISNTISFYMQKEFTVNAIDDVTDGALFMDYDDGFVAYLNGTEIARSSNMGDSGRVVEFNAPAGGNHEALMYNGAAPEAYYFSERLDLLKEGSNILAIEVHNVSAGSSDMSAIPFFLLGYNSYQDGLIYRNPFFVVKDKYPHTNFKIQSAGEALFLSDNDGTIVDKIDNIKLPPDFSYGRVPDDSLVYGYYTYPTPGSVNGLDYSTEYITDSVQFVTLIGHDFDTYQRIKIESGLLSDEIRYTTDGSKPTKNSLVFRGILDINQTTVLKARIFRSNSLPGPVNTKTFFIGETHELPVISVSMDPYDLWDYNNGIYVLGPNASSEQPNSGANFWQDWERPAHFEIYNEDHELVLSQDAGTKIFGGWSRAHPQKSMAFYARKNYGDGSFSYPLFKERTFDSYEAFVLRNDGNDWCNGLFRDGLSAYISAQMNIDHQAYQPYVMYLNGEYWGIINMREKVNEHFIASNHNVYADDVNILEGNSWLVHGNPDSYIKMYDYVTSTNLSGWMEYNEAKSMLDVSNYIRYYVLNVYIDNKDWPGNNNKFWSTNAPGSLYRWISFDTDFGYSIWDDHAYEFNTLLFSLGEGEINWATQDWATALIRSLLTNDNFKRQFINEFADRMNTTLHPDQMIPVVDSFQQRLMSEAPAHYERWIENPYDWLSYPNWLTFVERMRIFFRERPQIMREQLMDRFNLSGTLQIEVKVSDPEAGNVQINSVVPNSYPFKGIYFKNVPIGLKAIPSPGYVFSHWEGDMESDTSTFSYNMEIPGQFTAVFEAVDSAANIVINEINYASSSKRNTEDWVELYNNSGVKVDLSGWSLGDGFSGESFVIPEGTVLAADNYLVISRNQPDFKRFYPELRSLIGNFGFGINSEGDGIALYDQDGNLHDHVIFESIAPWPEAANGTGLTMELKNPGLDNEKAENWKASREDSGTPAALNSQFEELEVNVDAKITQNLKHAIRVYPSPFNSETNIYLNVDTSQKFIISVYSASGRLVDQLLNADLESGKHSISWKPGANIQAGLYFINIRSEKLNETMKVVYQ